MWHFIVNTQNQSCKTNDKNTLCESKKNLKDYYISGGTKEKISLRYNRKKKRFKAELLDFFHLVHSEQ